MSSCLHDVYSTLELLTGRLCLVVYMMFTIFMFNISSTSVNNSNKLSLKLGLNI